MSHPPPAPKRSNTGLVVVIVIGAALVLGGLATVGVILAGRAADRLGDAGEPTVQAYDLGQSATVNTDGTQLRITVARAEWIDEPCTLTGALLSDRLVLLDVTIEVISGPGLVSPANFEFHADDGTVTVVGVNASGCVQSPLEFVPDAATDRTISGQIDFDVSSGGDVRYTVPTVDRTIVAWRVPAS